MNVFDTIRSLLSRGGRTTVLRECRDCGTTVEDGSNTCPCCDNGDVVRHEIP